MSEWRERSWYDAIQRGYEALVGGEALYDEIDAEQGRAHAWFAMARELSWQRDDYGGAAR